MSEGAPAPAASSRPLAAGLRLAETLFDRMARETAAPDGSGVWRDAYGAGEALAHAAVAEAARDLGLEEATDAAGNLFLTLPGRDRSRSVIIGSHLDSVPYGGNYDGLAGVLAGLGVAACLRAEGQAPPVDLTVLAIRGEESCWFPSSYIGSRMALGRLEPALLDSLVRQDTGRSLGRHIAEAGFDPQAVARGERRLDPDRVVAFIEPHIEQGPVLAEAGLPVGVVTGIRGSRRFRRLTVHGEWGHSGTTPRALRRDAAVGAARLVVGLDRVYAEADAGATDLTVTVCQIQADPSKSSFSKIAGEVALSIDLRSVESDPLDRAVLALDRLVGELEAATGLKVDKGSETVSTPARMDAGVMAALEAGGEAAGVPLQRLASGAGHDAATFAAAGIATGMLFWRSYNGSHNPDEHMDMDDFAAGLAVLRGALDRL
jgi:N-carbamoyl-L-amino-acid hydrolase